MLSKSNLKYIKSLQIKKIRNQENLFLVEGKKSVLELCDSDFTIQQLLCTEEFFNENNTNIPKTLKPIIVSNEELNSASSFVNNHSALAIAFMKANIEIVSNGDEYILLLDDVKDPGNLGTIIRIADWYGIKKIIATDTTTEIYNPKVIAASMGSFSRIQIYYCDMVDYLSQHKTYVYAASLEGKNLHESRMRKGPAMIMMGNESIGIHPKYQNLIDEYYKIPCFGKAESLNVAVATALFCDAWKRSA